MKAGDVAARMSGAYNKDAADRIGDDGKYDRDMVRVSRYNAAVTGVPNARITFGFDATNSLANFRISSTSLPAQRISICTRFVRLSNRVWQDFA